MSHKAIAVSIEVDRRQQYIFETDKLQEMLGASRIIAETVKKANLFFKEEDGLKLFSPVSGEIRVWALEEKKHELLNQVWSFREQLMEQGVEHSIAYLETRKEHFENDVSETAKIESDQTGKPVDSGPVIPDLSLVHRELGKLIKKQKDAKIGTDARPRCSLFANCRIHGLDQSNAWYPDRSSCEKAVPPIEDNEERRQLIGWRASKKREMWWKERKELYSKLIIAAYTSAGLNAPDENERTKLILKWKWSQRFDGFKSIEGGDDSYIAYACGDGDGMGELLSNLNWNCKGENGWPADSEPWERNRDFSIEFEKLVNRAFETATNEMFKIEELEKAVEKSINNKKDEIHRNAEQGSEEAVMREEIEKVLIKQPKMLPQLLGGDDLWMVGEKKTIFEVCKSFIQNYEDYENLAKEGHGFPTLSKALQVAKAGQRPEEQYTHPLRYTVSMGIAFAKAGHPASEMIDSAESLMKSAKNLRKGKLPLNCKDRKPHLPEENPGNPAKSPQKPEAPGKPSGCVDWHWIESSLPEKIKDLRSRGWMYKGTNNETMLLTTRPWTHREAEVFYSATVPFQKVPRRKREQLEEILRMGKTLGDLAWKSWWDGLDDTELVTKAVQDLGVWKPGDLQSSPWVELPKTAANGKANGPVYSTPFLDLLALQHVLGRAGKAS